jgi:hypothetical protein
MGRQCDECISSKLLRTNAFYQRLLNTAHRTYERNDLCWFGDQSVGQLFVERDEVPDIDVAIILFEEHVLTDLISSGVLVVDNTWQGEK